MLLQFPTPIANAWTLESGRLQSLDLFDAKNIPALGFELNDEMIEGVPPSPALYIGRHQKQIYVQPSVQTISAYEQTLTQAMSQGQLPHMPKVNWKPYLASGELCLITHVDRKTSSQF